jgi:hypothetical protein
MNPTTKPNAPRAPAALPLDPVSAPALEVVVAIVAEVVVAELPTPAVTEAEVLVVAATGVELERGAVEE